MVFGRPPVKNLIFINGRFMNRPYDQEERKSWITRLRSFIRFPSNLVGTGVPDGPESNKFCFLYGYWYVAIRKANAFSSWTVEDAGPYRQKNSNRINTPIRSENLIVSGSSGTSTPTGKMFNRIDTPLHLLQLISVSILGSEAARGG